MQLEPSGQQLRILDFDIETRRIGFHNAGRFAPDGCEPVVIAAAFEDGPVSTWGYGNQWTIERYRDMVEEFADLWNEADIVTGHYIRKFDIPILNGAMLECGLPPLDQKLVSDTKIDLLDVAGLSQSQENLAALRRLEEDKFHQNDNRWRELARLTTDGLANAYQRVHDDVIQHRALRAELAPWLRAPELWRP